MTLANVILSCIIDKHDSPVIWISKSYHILRIEGIEDIVDCRSLAILTLESGSQKEVRKVVGTLKAGLKAAGLRKATIVRSHLLGTVIGNGTTSKGRLRSWILRKDLTLLTCPSSCQETSVEGACGMYVAGTAFAGNITEAVLWSNLKPTLLEKGNAMSASATDVNSQGVVVGATMNKDSVLRAAIWKMGSLQRIKGLDSYKISSARGINERGDVVGCCLRNGTEKTFLYRRNRLSFLPGLMAFPNVNPNFINVHGEIVGNAFDSAYRHSRPVIWRGNKARDLNSLIHARHHEVLETAEQIDEFGRIVGLASTKEMIYSYLLTPKSVRNFSLTNSRASPQMRDPELFGRRGSLRSGTTTSQSAVNRPSIVWSAKPNIGAAIRR